MDLLRPLFLAKNSSAMMPVLWCWAITFHYGKAFSRILKVAVKNAEQEKRATVFGYYVNDPERFGIVDLTKQAK